MSHPDVGKCINCGLMVTYSEYDGIFTHSELAFGHDGLGENRDKDPKEYNNGFWCDRTRRKNAAVSKEDWEAWRTENPRPVPPKPPEWYENDALITVVTAVVRKADNEFVAQGGSSRHWVRDHFLPLLNEAGLRISRLEQK